MTKPTKWLCVQRRLRSAWASAQSDQNFRCPHEKTLRPQLPIERTAKTLIRLGGCPGRSESSLGAHSFCWLCHVAAQFRFTPPTEAEDVRDARRMISNKRGLFEPAHEIMALFVLRKRILQNAHAQPSSGARCLMFCRTLRLLPYFMCANSEGSGEPVRIA